MTVRIAMFHNLTKEEQEQILNYDLMIYYCEGNDKEKRRKVHLLKNQMKRKGTGMSLHLGKIELPTLD